jgi:thioesterase domain-containing protein
MSELASIDPPRTTGALNALFSRISRNSDRVILPINDIALSEDRSAPAFYCVHSLSGAGGTDFSELAGLMPAIRFYGIQAPPKKMQDGTFGDSVRSIADHYASDLVKFQPEGRFLLGGWSAGAAIGLAVAQNLQARGREVALLAAIDTAPENTGLGLRPWDPRYILEVVGNLSGWFIHDVFATKGGLPRLLQRVSSKIAAHRKMALARARGEKMFSGYAVEGFMDLSTYPVYQQSFMKRLYNSLITHIAEGYSGKVVVYEATIKPLFKLPQVGRVWRRFAPNSTLVRIKGTHLSILREPSINVLARDLQKRILTSLQ